jgi:hypothetical protein
VRCHRLASSDDVKRVVYLLRVHGSLLTAQVAAICSTWLVRQGNSPAACNTHPKAAACLLHILALNHDTHIHALRHLEQSRHVFCSPQ